MHGIRGAPEALLDSASGGVEDGAVHAAVPQLRVEERQTHRSGLPQRVEQRERLVARPGVVDLLQHPDQDRPLGVGHRCGAEVEGRPALDVRRDAAAERTPGEQLVADAPDGRCVEREAGEAVAGDPGALPAGEALRTRVPEEHPAVGREREHSDRQMLDHPGQQVVGLHRPPREPSADGRTGNRRGAPTERTSTVDPLRTVRDGSVTSGARRHVGVADEGARLRAPDRPRHEPRVEILPQPPGREQHRAHHGQDVHVLAEPVQRLALQVGDPDDAVRAGRPVHLRLRRPRQEHQGPRREQSGGDGLDPAVRAQHDVQQHGQEHRDPHPVMRPGHRGDQQRGERHGHHRDRLLAAAVREPGEGQARHGDRQGQQHPHRGRADRVAEAAQQEATHATGSRRSPGPSRPRPATGRGTGRAASTRRTRPARSPTRRASSPRTPPQPRPPPGSAGSAPGTRRRSPGRACRPSRRRRRRP